MSIRTGKTETASIPSWAIDESPSIFNLFSAICLAGLEGKRIKLTANDQRKLIGFPIFGRRLVTFTGSAVEMFQTKDFGKDFESSTWTPGEIDEAAKNNKQLFA